MNKVLAFGEILWDIIDGKKYLGGAPLNFAVHYAQCGGESAILSHVGLDRDGIEAIRQIEKLGVLTGFVQSDMDKPTGTVTVSLHNGQPSYTIHEDVAYDNIAMPNDVSALSAYKSFYFGTLAQRKEESRRTLLELLKKCQFEKVFYDVNLRQSYFSGDILKSSIAHCTMLKLNDEEVEVISNLVLGKVLSFDDFVKETMAKFTKLKLVIITKGAKGCTVYHQGQKYDVASEKVQVADTVGAGDSFSASFLACHCKGMDVRRSAEIANKVAGFVASSQGPTPEYTQVIKDLVGLA